MQIRLRNVLAVGALTSGLLAGGALVANAATTSTTAGNSGTSSTSSSSDDHTLVELEHGELRLELRAPALRLDQELPEHGQRLELQPAHPRPDPAPRRRRGSSGGSTSGLLTPPRSPAPTTEERAVWAGSATRSAPPPLGGRTPARTQV